MNHQAHPNGSNNGVASRMLLHREVKIIPFVLIGQLGNNLSDAERLIGDYLNDGWIIEAAGGAGGDAGLLGLPPGGRPEEYESAWAIGFIVLYRTTPHFPKEWHVPSFSEDEISTNGVSEE
jgi:hypothetical protein